MNEHFKNTCILNIIFFSLWIDDAYENYRYNKSQRYSDIIPQFHKKHKDQMKWERGIWAKPPVCYWGQKLSLGFSLPRGVLLLTKAG